MLAGNYGENGRVAEGRRWKKSPEVLEKGGRDITAPANAHTHTHTHTEFRLCDALLLLSL